MDISKEELKSNIETLRSQMIASALENGFTSTKTIKISKKLDILIYKYQKLIHSKENT